MPGSMISNSNPRPSAISTGQDFRRMGTRGNTYAFAAGDIEAMSNRLLIVGRQAAHDAQQVIEDNIVKYVHPDSDHGFKYSEGRLAATIGTWKPDLIQDERVLAAAESWAADNDVAFEAIDTGASGEQTIIENGAYRSVKRYRSDTYAVEVGTFTPYAGLVEDGGDMEIHPYGNPGLPFVTAHWEAHNMFANGLFDSIAELEKMLDARVKAAL